MKTKGMVDSISKFCLVAYYSTTEIVATEGPVGVFCWRS